MLGEVHGLFFLLLAFPGDRSGPVDECRRGSMTSSVTLTQTPAVSFFSLKVPSEETAAFKSITLLHSSLIFDGNWQTSWISLLPIDLSIIIIKTNLLLEKTICIVQ